MTQISENPYVGPRTFTRAEADRFFGREQEADELRSLVVSERLALFYAQSGAGKSSLINTRLIPQLHQAGFAVLPVARVSGQLPAGVNQVDNIFIFNLLLSLDKMSKNPPQRFSQMSFSHFLRRLTSPDGMNYYYDDYSASIEPEADSGGPRYILIIDQFEEIVTTNLARWQEREVFFHQLNQAMADDPLLWVVLTLREDYLATLDPFAPLLSDKLRARFYMQRMEAQAALEAIKKPAELVGRPFAPHVAEKLVDNLCQIRVYGQDKPQLGQFIEPVQLQVVCYQLWENLKQRSLPVITHKDLQEAGDVDVALTKFYEQALNKALGLKVSQEAKLSEASLRDWFSTKIITEAGTRGAVYRGEVQTGGLPTPVADFLEDEYILRTETRAGGKWYELVHDRLIEPILKSNREWHLFIIKQVPLGIQVLWAISLSTIIIVLSSAVYAIITGLSNAPSIMVGTILAFVVSIAVPVMSLISLALIRFGISVRNFVILTRRGWYEKRDVKVFIRYWWSRENSFVLLFILILLIFSLCVLGIWHTPSTNP